MNTKNYHGNKKRLFQIAAIASFAIITFSQQAFSQSIVQGGSPGTTVALFQGANLQTANLTEWNINGGSTLAFISKTGAASFAGLSLTSPLPIGSGGTGLSATPTNGQLLIGTASGGFALANITGGTGLSVTNGSGTIALANTGVTSNVAGTGISVSSATGSSTISNTGVLSVTGTAPIVSSGGQNPAISLGALGQSANSVFQTASINPATATLTLITGLTQTINVPANSVVIMSTYGGMDNNQTTSLGYASAQISFIVDGTTLTNAGGNELITSANNTGATLWNWAPWSLTQAITLSAGSHTIAVAGNRNGLSTAGNTPLIGGGNGSSLQGVLTVMIIKL